ncbi:MAG: flagellar basal body-associated FliL family protein [Rhodothermales bacterium]|nr:flagellar basal body-associated FliL family protein [Rhodothermales bacterium]
MIAVVLVAIGGGAAAAYLFFPQVTAMITNTGEAAEEIAEAEPVEYGEFMELKGFMVNPSDTNGRRALMVDVGLEGPSTKTLEAVVAKEILIRDKILGKLSKLSVAELADVSIRDSIKLDLLDNINALLDPEEEEQLSRLYFTAFIIN